MMSLQKPPLRRSASTIESTNRSAPLLTPPTSLNLHSSHNQQLNCDTIKEGVVMVSTETQCLAQPPKSSQKYTLTSIHHAIGLNQSPAPSAQRRAKPVKSASSSSLHCSSAVPLSFSSSNSKLAKNGTNLQLKEERLDLNKNDKNHNDFMCRRSCDWLEGKGNQKNPTIRRRTKSFLEYHREEKVSVSPDKDLVSQEEKHLLSKLEEQTWAKENHVEAHLTLPQNHLLLLTGEEELSLKPLEVYRRPDNERPRDDSTDCVSPAYTFHLRGEEADGSPAPPKKQEEEEEEEDSSWTTLSQETPSVESPRDTAGVWEEGCQGERVSRECFWNDTAQGKPSESCEVKTDEEVKSVCLSVPPPRAHTERPSSIISDSSVEPVPSPAASSHSSSSLCYETMGRAASVLNNNYLDPSEASEPKERENQREEVREQEQECLGAHGGPYSFINHRAQVPADTLIPINDMDTQVFWVNYLGWLEVADVQVMSSKSSSVISDCIQQLQREHEHTGDEGQAMLLVLQDVTLTLKDPIDHTLLHSLPISCMRVWGVGRGLSRDFAYVAQDKNTRVLKCHVYECDGPAEPIGSSLTQICTKIMAERRSLSSAVESSSHITSDVPLRELSTPKMKLQQSFHVLYLGSTSVLRPTGMDMINRAINSLMSSAGKEDWTPVLLNIADASITVFKEKEEEEDVLVECRVRFLCFMGVGRDVHIFAFIMDTGKQHFQCHVFWCDPNAGGVSEAMQSACVLRYQKCLGKSSSSAPAHADSVTRRVTSSMKRGVQSIIDTLKKKPAPDVPHQ
ncbi:amyloid beta precursor protein binding family B member 2 isoform X2 [Triplophysa dalaica]|uniref:amyloid beta precursor protein binding family B member 2 isoform X2 n=1 Tax=Triplophysa dalaica TaxID=1582913 RepID=UPI0024DFA0E7|nr:amyloid beta precursor protein binding family B member 2 isoform X2 [Triplophysa dalaica]